MGNNSQEVIMFTIKHLIDRCGNQCNFYQRTMDGAECTHPARKNKQWTENLVGDAKIFPKWCPLKKSKIKPKKRLLIYDIR